jgi:hypothetical protein
MREEADAAEFSFGGVQLTPTKPTQIAHRPCGTNINKHCHMIYTAWTPVTVRKHRKQCNQTTNGVQPFVIVLDGDGRKQRHGDNAAHTCSYPAISFGSFPHCQLLFACCLLFLQRMHIQTAVLGVDVCERPIVRVGVTKQTRWVTAKTVAVAQQKQVDGKEAESKRRSSMGRKSHASRGSLSL